MNESEKKEISNAKMNNNDVRKELNKINFDAINFENLNELEEIVTPFNGVVSCCQ